MLTNPCACKGSLSYVHEACLIQWLLQKNIRKCELCHSEFDIIEKYGTFWEILRNTVKYMFSNYKRMFKFAIYSVYMYLFFKRFVYVLRYFKDLAFSCLKAYVRMLKAVFKFIFLAPKTSLENLIKSYDFGFLNSLQRMINQVKSKFAQSAKPTRRPKFKAFMLGLFG